MTNTGYADKAQGARGQLPNSLQCNTMRYVRYVSMWLSTLRDVLIVWAVHVRTYMIGRGFSDKIRCKRS